MIKAVIISLFILNTIYELFTLLLETSGKNRELPSNVKDVYDEERYRTFLSYQKESSVLSFYSVLSRALVNLLFLVFNLHSYIFSLFGNMNIYLEYFLIIVLFSLLSTIIRLPFSWYGTFSIEEKYGMNKTTKMTFFMDMIKKIILSIILETVLLFVMIYFFSTYGIKGVIGTAAAVVVISLSISALVVPLLKMFNSFTPLEEGELKNKLLALCKKYNVAVKRIVVKDASKRTTTSNAFCTGLKKKTISIDDNLIKSSTTDEIVAVFAHEFAHAKFKHVLKTLPFSLLRSIISIVFFGLILECKELFYAFGFTGVNYYFAMTLLESTTWPVEIIASIILNYISRKHEYEADRFAAKEGYGDALISALKKLHSDSLSEINPHKWTIITEYSHPTLSDRITAIQKAEK